MAMRNVTGARLALRVLGGFDLWVGDHSVVLPMNAQRVLGYLVVTGAQARRDVLAGHLWGGSPQSRAQANLRTALWRIRQVSCRLVDCRRDVVSLTEEVDVDYARVTARAHGLVDSESAPLELLSTTPRMLEGDLLPGWDEDWLLVDRERHRQLRMHALEALSRHLAARGEYGRAVDAAYAAIAIEPLYESAQAALIQAHLAEGNRTEALRQFTAFRRMLLADAGLEPSLSLVTLVRSAVGEGTGLPGPARSVDRGATGSADRRAPAPTTR
jgi:DNA-binding SARP family transcriptional activator